MIFGRRPDPTPPSRRGSEEYGLGTTDTDRNDVSVGWARSFSFAGTVLIVGFLLVFLRSILVPFVAALFLAYLVRPLAESISACRCIPFFRKRHEAAMLKEQEDEEKEPLMGGEGEKGATPGRRRLLQDVPKDSRQLIGRVETLLPKWVGVMLALILALGVIADRADEPVSVAEVAQLTGVTDRTLRYAFEEAYGLSPKQYLQAYRLNKVHRHLRQARKEGRNVSDVANEWGFWHMGQFARDYRRMFGSLPAETCKWADTRPPSG